MDHLTLPADQFAATPLDVPFVCSQQFSYDDMGFLTFPSRVGVDLSILETTQRVAVDTLAPFLQAWLWFGLLGEVLHVGSRADRLQKVASWKEFVCERSDGSRVICTTHLPEVIHRFKSKLASDHFRAQHLSRVDSCLDVAASASHLIISSPSFRHRVDTLTPFRELPSVFRILLSVQLLIESLDATLTYLIPSRPIRSPWKRYRTQAKSQLVNILLHESGWEQNGDIRLPDEWRLRYFLGFLHPVTPPVDTFRQVNCSADQNQSLNYRPKTVLSPRHVLDPCRCRHFSLDDVTVADLWRKNKVPTITFGSQPGMMRELRVWASDCDDSTSFTAISHVRRAGLGNDDANSLPYCQLTRIQELVNQVSSADKGSRTQTPYWIDTMCLPRDTNAKRIGLSRLRHVYKSASQVLVLDPCLYKHHVSTVEEALIRIRFSLWNERLWTLQEGALAKKLWFLFSNRMLSLSDMIEEYEKAYNLPILPRMDVPYMPFKSIYLEQVLARVDQNLKSVKSRLQHSIDKGNTNMAISHRVRTVLRLGYLAFPRYRYFRSKQDIDDIETALRAIFMVYFDITLGTPRVVTELTEQVIIDDLYKLDALVRTKNTNWEETGQAIRQKVDSTGFVW